MQNTKQMLGAVGMALLMASASCTYNTTVKATSKDSLANGQLPAGNDETADRNDKPGRTDTGTMVAPKPAAGVSDAWLLVPGQSAGMTRLDENAEKVYDKLGAPDGGDAAMQKAVAIWYTAHDSTSHSVAIYTSREPGKDPVARIRQIRITSPTFQTAEGIGPGSALAGIQKAFDVKKTEQYRDQGITYTVYDSPKGIAFEVGPDGNCVAVVIHEAGVTGQGTYLKFRTTNKFITRRKYTA